MPRAVVWASTDGAVYARVTSVTRAYTSLRVACPSAEAHMPASSMLERPADCMDARARSALQHGSAREPRQERHRPRARGPCRSAEGTRAKGPSDDMEDKTHFPIQNLPGTSPWAHPSWPDPPAAPSLTPPPPWWAVALMWLCVARYAPHAARGRCSSCRPAEPSRACPPGRPPPTSKGHGLEDGGAHSLFASPYRSPCGPSCGLPLPFS
jgi:hypothetical protein